jgi:hypothetical protein
MNGSTTVPADNVGPRPFEESSSGDTSKWICLLRLINFARYYLALYGVRLRHSERRAGELKIPRARLYTISVFEIIDALDFFFEPGDFDVVYGNYECDIREKPSSSIFSVESLTNSTNLQEEP